MDQLIAIWTGLNYKHFCLWFDCLYLLVFANQINAKFTKKAKFLQFFAKFSQIFFPLNSAYILLLFVKYNYAKKCEISRKKLRNTKKNVRESFRSLETLMYTCSNEREEGRRWTWSSKTRIEPSNILANQRWKGLFYVILRNSSYQWMHVNVRSTMIPQNSYLSKNNGVIPVFKLIIFNRCSLKK